MFLGALSNLLCRWFLSKVLLRIERYKSDFSRSEFDHEVNVAEGVGCSYACEISHMSNEEIQ